MDQDTNTDRTQVIDRGRGNFTILPNALLRGQLAPNLSVHACWLYSYLKSITGDTGQCWQGHRRMAAGARMSVGMVSKAKRELAEAKLIVITRRDEQTDLVEILDIWWANAEASVEGRSPGEQGDHQVIRGDHQVIRGDHQVIVRRCTEEEPKKKTKGVSSEPATWVLSQLPDKHRTDKRLPLAIREYVEYRRQRRKPITKLAATRLANQLATQDPGDCAAALQRSVDRGWTGVFFEADDGKKDGANSAQPTLGDWAY